MSASENSKAKYCVEDGVAIARIANPAVNALGIDVRNDLADAVRRAAYFTNAGIPVTIAETTQEALGGLKRVADRLAAFAEETGDADMAPSPSCANSPMRIALSENIRARRHDLP